MLSVYLICVGKLKEKFYQEACAEYVKRLSAYCRLTLVELPEEKLPQAPSQGQIDQALAREAAAIRAKLPPSAVLAALCVEGRMRSSEELAQLVGTWEQSSAKIQILRRYVRHPVVRRYRYYRVRGYNIYHIPLFISRRMQVHPAYSSWFSGL